MYFQQPTYKEQMMIDTTDKGNNYTKSNPTEDNDDQTNSETDSDDLKAQEQQELDDEYADLELTGLDDNSFGSLEEIEPFGGNRNRSNTIKGE